jgi:hypothetical protein
VRRPHEFKIACLQDILALFPQDWNPFYAGFGNRDTDEVSYRCQQCSSDSICTSTVLFSLLCSFNSVLLMCLWADWAVTRLLCASSLFQYTLSCSVFIMHMCMFQRLASLAVLRYDPAQLRAAVPAAPVLVTSVHASLCNISLRCCKRQDC